MATEHHETGWSLGWASTKPWPDCPSCHAAVRHLFGGWSTSVKMGQVLAVGMARETQYRYRCDAIAYGFLMAIRHFQPNHHDERLPYIGACKTWRIYAWLCLNQYGTSVSMLPDNLQVLGATFLLWTTPKSWAHWNKLCGLNVRVHIHVPTEV